MFPLYDGHRAGGSIEPGGSCSRCKSSTTLSTDTKSIWSWPYRLQRAWVESTTIWGQYSVSFVRLSAVNLHPDAATRTNAVSPGETPVYSASSVKRNVEHADRASKRYISQACKLLYNRSISWLRVDRSVKRIRGMEKIISEVPVKMIHLLKGIRDNNDPILETILRAKRCGDQRQCRHGQRRYEPRTVVRPSSKAPKFDIKGLRETICNPVMSTHRSKTR